MSKDGGQLGKAADYGLLSVKRSPDGSCLAIRNAMCDEQKAWTLFSEEGEISDCVDHSAVADWPDLADPVEAAALGLCSRCGHFGHDAGDCATTGCKCMHCADNTVCPRCGSMNTTAMPDGDDGRILVCANCNYGT